MTDYRRMEWQYWANRISIFAKFLLIVIMLGEADIALKYHFPLWDDIAMPLTVLAWEAVTFVEKSTSIYRIDL